jgi:hypothetical protein
MAGRYLLNGRLKMRFLATLPVAPLAPTQAQLNAGVNLIGSQQEEELVEITGWEVQTSSIPTPGYAGITVGNVAGEQTYPDSSLTWYKVDTTEVIYSAMDDGVTGYLAFMPDGQGVGKEVDLYPVTVASRPRSPARNAAHTFKANFSVAAPYKGTQAA